MLRLRLRPYLFLVSCIATRSLVAGKWPTVRVPVARPFKCAGTPSPGPTPSAAALLALCPARQIVLGALHCTVTELRRAGHERKPDSKPART